MTNASDAVHLTIDAAHFDDIPGFYAEINRVFMANEEWALGHSLDALDDLLYGAYGAAKGAGLVYLHWTNIEKSRHDLGLDATRNWLSQKLERPEHFNRKLITDQLQALEDGSGQTFFDIVLEIFASHASLKLISA